MHIGTTDDLIVNHDFFWRILNIYNYTKNTQPPGYSLSVDRTMSDTWKVSKYGVISGPHFPIFGLNTGKYGPEITTYLDIFHAVSVNVKFENKVFHLFMQVNLISTNFGLVLKTGFMMIYIFSSVMIADNFAVL